MLLVTVSCPETQSEIFNKQFEKHIKHKFPTVAVLSANKYVKSA
jgi:hypothetical protein